MMDAHIKVPLVYSTYSDKDQDRSSSFELEKSIEDQDEDYKEYWSSRSLWRQKNSTERILGLMKASIILLGIVLASCLLGLYIQSRNLTHRRVAVATTLYSDSYLDGALVLGHSLEEHSSRPLERVILYIPGRLKNSTLCSLEANGWKTIPVDRIAPPKALEGKVWSQFIDQFTKLRLWQLEQYDNILYVDSDCLVKGDISDMFDLPGSVDFAAVPDVWAGKEHKAQFNAGVLYIKPNQTLFEIFLAAIGTTEYDFGMAEQGFLNKFYEYTALRLPYTWNANLATKYWPEEWKDLFDHAKIVHYTIEKPMVEGRETDEYRYENTFWHDQNKKMRTPEHVARRNECAARDVVAPEEKQ